MNLEPGFVHKISLNTEKRLRILREVVHVLTSDDDKGVTYKIKIRRSSHLEDVKKNRMFVIEAIVSEMEMDDIDDTSKMTSHLEDEMENRIEIAEATGWNIAKWTENVMEMDSINEKNSEAIINHLTKLQPKREIFLREYPTWAARRADCIKKLEEIFVSVKLLKLRTDFLKRLVEYTAYLGGSVCLASPFIIPSSSSRFEILCMCASFLIPAACLAYFGIDDIEQYLLEDKLIKAQEIIEEANTSSLRIRTFLNPTFHSEKDLSEPLNIALICFRTIKVLLDEGIKIKDDRLRLVYIKITLDALIGRISKAMQDSSYITVKEAILVQVKKFLMVSLAEPLTKDDDDL